MMKYAALVFLCFSPIGAGQEMKHMMDVAANGERAVTLSAIEIERRGQYPSAVYLKGAVEIKKPVCIPAGKHGSQVCDGLMIVHADEATFHEDSGDIEARGAVTITRHHERAK